MKTAYRRWPWILILGFIVSCGAQKAQRADSPARSESRTAEAEQVAEEASTAADAADDEAPPPPIPGLKDLIDGNQAFAFDVHKSVDDPDLVYSPHSISTAFGPLYAGAAGDTRDEIGRVMHYKAVGESQLHTYFAKLASELESRENEDDESERGFRLRISNSIWAAEGLDFSMNFLKVTEQNYLMTPRALDFRGDPDAARKRINTFVEQSTAGKIQDFLKEGDVDKETRVVLTNAVYFNAGWMLPFSKASTKDADFKAANGTKKHPFMRQLARHRYLEGRGFKMLELPYAGGQVSAFIVLPEEGKFDEVDRSMTREKFAWSRQNMRSQQVDVRLPKFKLRSRLELGEMLRGMGMKSPFDARKSDFGPMFSSRENVVISKVLHEGYISVDEAGTEAAAVTGGIMRPTGGVIGAPREFHANRPFSFFIVDKPTGAILFTARVSNPRI